MAKIAASALGGVARKTRRAKKLVVVNRFDTHTHTHTHKEDFLVDLRSRHNACGG